MADRPRAGSVPPKGRLLAVHPDAQALTDELVRGLTVRKLLLLANVLHNRCRPPAAALRSPEQHAGEAAKAWQDVRLDMANMQMRDATAWTGTVKLLFPGAEAELTVVGQLRIPEIVRVCQRIVAGPYSEAARRGLTLTIKTLADRGEVRPSDARARVSSEARATTEQDSTIKADEPRYS